MTIESSSSKVPYDLRPRKQIERRMMASIFQNMAEVGFPISTYRYTGFGGFFFVDFILFRKLLGITDMVSIEHDQRYKKRIKFNCPYQDIDAIIQSSSEYISKMSRDKAHILWLDYDGPINHDHLIDIHSAASFLCAGSILIATFDVDFERANDTRIKESEPNKRFIAWFNLFKDECGDLFDPTWNNCDFTASSLHRRVTTVTRNAILSGTNIRDEIEFEPLFNFIYADGHEMLTLGGLISSKHDRKKLRSIEWENIPFARRNLTAEPFRIEVPVLTWKERLHIDSYMPGDPEWLPEEFEIDPEEIQSYRKVYRYCPRYAELLL